MKCIVVIAAILAMCLASARLNAQTEAPRVARLGMLSDLERFGNPVSPPPPDWLASFRAGLRDSGYEEGKNVRFEFRNGDRDPEKLAKMAAELAAMKVDVIVASSTTAAKAAKAATHVIPIVFWGAEPISSGLVANLDHPGENLTGVTANEEQQAEFLAMLKEVVPDLKRVVILFNRSYAPVPGLLKNAESGARALGLSTRLVEMAAPGDLPGAFEAMKREGSRAVLVLNHGMFFRERAKLATIAIENGIAVSTPYLPNGEAGALIAHEPDFDQVWRLNASYVAKILKGANPGNLPVERLAAFRYSINLKTAKALGLTIPQSVLNRAALVIPNSGEEANQSSALGQAEQEVLVLEEQMEALQRSNSEARTALWAEDMVYINNNGAVFDKSRLAPAVSAGEVKIESLEVTERKIRVYGDVAVVTALEHMRASFHKKDTREFWQRFTRVWAWQSGKWQMVSFQATRISEPTVYALTTEGRASERPQTGPNSRTDKSGADGGLEQQIVSLDEEFEDCVGKYKRV